MCKSTQSHVRRLPLPRYPSVPLPPTSYINWVNVARYVNIITEADKQLLDTKISLALAAE